MAKQLRVELIAEASKFRGELAEAGKEAEGFSGKLAGIGKAAALAGGAAGLAIFSEALKIGFERSDEEEKILRQVETAIETTGGKAKVTAGQIRDFSTALQNKTGIDKLQIESTAKMLLAYTNVRNEVGKGNDIFNRAISLIEDYSVRTGKDATSSVTIFGKALQDPAKYLTSLARSGVVFSDSQKEVIKKMQDSGNLMGAQKIILAALQERYGGAAEAAGKTLGGQLSILKLRLEDVAQRIAEKVLPYVNRFVSFILDNWPKISAAVNTAFSAIGKAIDTVKPYIEGFVTVVGDLIHGKWSQAWDDLKTAVGKALTGLVDLAAQIGPKIYSAIGNLGKNILDKIGFGNLGSTFKRVFQDLETVFKGEIEIIKGIISGDWSKVWQGVKDVFRGVLDAAKDILQGLGQLIWDLLDKAAGLAAKGAAALGSVIWTGIQTGLGDLGQLIMDNVITPVTNAITGFATSVVTDATKVGSSIASSIASGITGAASAVTGAVTGFGAKIGALASSAWSGAVSVGKAIAGAIGKAVTGAASLVTAAVTGLGSAIGKLASAGWSAVKAVGTKIVGVIESGITGGVGKVTSAVVNIGGAIGRLAGNAWGAVRSLGSTLVGRVAEGITGGVGKITTAVINLGAAIGRLASRGWSSVKALGGYLVGQIASGIKDAAGQVLSAITGIFSGLAGWVKKILGIASPSRVFYEIGTNIVDGLVHGLKNGAGRMLDAAKNLALGILHSWPVKKIAEFLHDAYGSLSNVPSDLKAGLSDIWGSITSIFGDLWGDIKSIIGKIPGLAAGGIVTQPTVALIGEAGPEAVIPLSRASSMSLGHGATTVILKINDREMARALVESITREQNVAIRRKG